MAFGMFRNPTTHAARITRDMSKEDARFAVVLWAQAVSSSCTIMQNLKEKIC